MRGRVGVVVRMTREEQSGGKDRKKEKETRKGHVELPNVKMTQPSKHKTTMLSPTPLVSIYKRLKLPLLSWLQYSNTLGPHPTTTTPGFWITFF